MLVLICCCFRVASGDSDSGEPRVLETGNAPEPGQEVRESWRGIGEEGKEGKGIERKERNQEEFVSAQCHGDCHLINLLIHTVFSRLHTSPCLFKLRGITTPPKSWLSQKGLVHARSGADRNRISPDSRNYENLNRRH